MNIITTSKPIKPVSPSRTLADFLAKNTSLPVLVWWIILNFKYHYEENELTINRCPSRTSNTMKLRSGNKYMSNIDKNSTTDTWFADSYNICANFEKIRNSKLKGTIQHDRMIYDGLIKQMDFIMKWIQIIVLNAISKDYINNFMERGLFPAITRVYNDIYKPNLIKDPKYKIWCSEIVEDLKLMKDYIKCPCGWIKTPQNKCHECIDFEQYFYNFDTYNDNFTVLRSGKKILKRGGINRKPILINKVYLLV